MGMLVEGLNLFRDDWESVITKAEIGTGTTPATAQDTALENSIGVTTTDITTTKTDQFIRFTIRFPSTSATGDDITELLLSNASTNLSLVRIVFEQSTEYEIGKDLVIYARYYFKGRR